MFSPRVKQILFSPRVITGLVLAMLAYGIFLWSDYRQLVHAFFSQEQFIPTRIFSDVARIAPPQLKQRVTDRLKILAYSYQDNGDTLSFSLHQRDYPDYLLPAGHPELSAPNDSQGGSQVVLHFDGKLSDAALQSIQLNGQEIADLYLEPETIATLSRGPKEVRELVKFNDVPSLVWKAAIAVEDQHFLEHRGLDPRGIARAVWVDLRTRSFAQGGSTITLQLVKNLTARHGKNLLKKINEAFLALMLEARVDKEQILERYLNEVYLGQIGNLEIRGVAEGAKYFFGRSLEELNLAEIALMAGQIRGTGYYSPYTHRERALDRMKLVLRKMVETGMIAPEEEQSALQMPIRLAPPVTTQNKAPYFVDFVRAELYRELKDRMTEDEVNQAGLRVYTTLDSELNRIAQSAVSTGIASLEKQMGLASVGTPKPGDKLEGALASVDQSTGFIRALVGGKSYSQSTFNRILNMKRQVGSTFKPIVYLTAFLKGEDARGVPYSPAHPAEDHSWTLVYDGGKQSWSPRNYERDYMGWIDYRTALAHSINTVTARLGVEIGIPSVIQTARTLGIQSDLPAVPSLSLGVAELSPIEMLRAYETFANHGVQNDLEVIRAITDSDLRGIKRAVLNPKQVVDPGATDLLSSMLQSVFLEGTAREARMMGLDRLAAGKTGTTSNHRDAWFAGYTPQLTTVVWVGADESPGLDEQDETKEKKHHYRIALTGATSALPIWVDYMKRGLRGEPPIPFPISPYLQDIAVDRRTGFAARSDCRPEQVITDWFEKTHLPKFMTCEPNWPASVEKTSTQ